MNIPEPILLKELRGTDYKSLIKFRVHKILMICSHYDAFILEEDGQIYDAYSLIINIIKKAKEKILIIDNYIDDSILQMLVKKNKNV